MLGRQAFLIFERYSQVRNRMKNTIDLLRFQIELTKNMTAGLLVDMIDAPLAAPTPNGGNHPTWIAGHLAYSESNLIYHILGGDTNPLIEWKPLFGAGSQPSYEADVYPLLEDLLAKWDEVRVHTLDMLALYTDEDLDNPSINPPPGREDLFGTFGQVFSMVALHPLMHRGQISDARRAVGREVLIA